MIKLTRNNLVCVMFSLVCVSAVYGENKQLVLNENRLKALITDVPVQVPTFKAEYDKYMQTEIAPQEKVNLRENLITIVGKTKQKLEQELTPMGDRNVKKSIVAKGVAQTAGGLYGLVGVAFCYWIDYLRVTTHLTPQETKNNRAEDEETKINKIKAKSIRYWPFAVVHDVMNKVSEEVKRAMGVKGPANLYHSNSWWGHGPCVLFGFPFLFLATTTGVSCFQIKYGLDNMKKGANYKAHLNQRIKNLDEILRYINTHDAL